MEKRVFIAILLCFGVLAVYQVLFPAPPPTPATAGAPAATAAGGAAAPTPNGQPAAAAQPQPAAPAVPAAQPLVADSAARDITVDTNTVHAVFSTAGATLKSWTLKSYLEAGQPLDLVPADIPPTYPRPFTMSTNDPALSATLASALFRPSAETLTLGSTAGTLSFEYRDASGLNARKTFYFQPDGRRYVMRVEASVDQAGVTRPVTIATGLGLGLGYQPDGSRSLPMRAVQLRGDKIERLSASNLAKQARYDAQMEFAGVEDQYFLSAALPGQQPVTVEYAPVTLPVPNDPAARTRAFVGYSLTVPGPLSVPFFLGPKDLDVLRAVDPQLVRSIDFGFFAVIVVPLLQALKWINGFVGNYGWSIVVLTIILNVLMFPLRHRSMVSMRKMQAVQPEVKAIQDRYAKYKVTDPERQKMNQEMMALYKQKGVNPVSGCVPMLLTMPVLFAFYAMLYAAIELRGAPFVGWIHDLSRHDPFYITPLLMGLTMFWQQRMMPSTADPIQQKMFLLMPVIFTVSFLWAPAGLVVYWLLSNLLAIGQQYFTNRMIGAPVRPQPVRARASAGNGRAAKS